MESTSPFRLIEVLQRHDVPFVIIGGHAVTYHGYVRATEDVDIIFWRSAESEVSLLRALQEMNAHWIGNDIDPATGVERLNSVTAAYVRGTHLMMLETDVGFLDIFDFIPGHEDRSVSEIFDSACESKIAKFASLSWLRKMKLASARPKDQLDLENLPNDDSKDKLE